MRIRATATILILLSLNWAPAGAAGPLDGLGVENRRQPDSLIDRRSNKSAVQAANEARAQYGGGKVLDVKETPGGYRVKLLSKGDVRIVFISR